MHSFRFPLLEVMGKILRSYLSHPGDHGQDVELHETFNALVTLNFSPPARNPELSSISVNSRVQILVDAQANSHDIKWFDVPHCPKHTFLSIMGDWLDAHLRIYIRWVSEDTTHTYLRQICTPMIVNQLPIKRTPHACATLPDQVNIYHFLMLQAFT